MAGTYASYPLKGGGGGVPTYANLAAFPSGTTVGQLGIAQDTLDLYIWNGSSWQIESGPNGILAIGTIDTGTPSANGAQDVSNTLVLQSASTSNPGLVNTTTQSFAGNKTFTGTIAASNLTGTNTGDVTLGTASGLSLSGQALSLQLATGSVPGALSAADWTTFNGKQAVFTIDSINSQPKNSNGMTFITNLLSLQTADTTHPGILNFSSQTIGGQKTFSTGITGTLTGNADTATTAAAWTTARNLAGNSVNGSADVAFANKFIVQGTADTGLSAAQFTGALGTGIVKNTTTTGVLSIAVAGDFPTLNQNTSGTAADLSATLSIAHGGTNATSVTIAPAATAWAGWDANKNLSANNHIEGYRTQATAASTLTLVVGDAYQQYFTGSTASQVVAMPATSTLVAGMQYVLINNSTQTIAVQSSGLNAIQTMAASSSMTLTVINTGVTTAAGWAINYTPPFASASTANNAVLRDGSSNFSAGTITAALTGTASGNTTYSANNHGVVLSGAANAMTVVAPDASTSKVLTSGGSSADPTWALIQGNATILKTPTLQKFTSTGTQTGWLFTISTSSTLAVGDTYTNNSNTYTVQGALTAQSGQVLYMSGTGATSGTTLTRSAGAGTASITFSTKLATALYTAPTGPSPLYLKIRLVGGGGGGGNSGTGSPNSGGNGNLTVFGPNLMSGSGGTGGGGEASGGVGGAASIGSALGVAFAGQSGGPNYINTSAFTDLDGAPGGQTPFGGAGTSVTYNANGGNAQTNTGSGGGGAGTGTGAGQVTGGGGGAGGYADAMITAPGATYPYIVGTGGAGGTPAGTSGNTGGAGADGIIVIEEHYQ